MHDMESKEKHCIVCFAKRTGLNYLRLEVCRACAVFFRRANQNRTVLKCRTDTNACQLDRDHVWACKKCRYERILQLCKEKIAKKEKLSQPGPSKCLEWNYDPISDKENVRNYLDEICPLNISPKLRRFRQCYNDLCRQRLVMDFGTLDNLPFNECGMIEAEASTSYNTASFIRRLYSEISTFLDAASEEFSVMPPDHKMKLFANFTRVWIPFECGYRTMKYFAKHQDRAFGSFGRYIDVSNFAQYYPGLTDTVFKKDASRMLQDIASKNYTVGKAGLLRLNLTDEEYIAITALLLWNLTSKSVPEELANIAEKNKTAALHDLYLYYKSVGTENYFVRLGEIFMFLHVLEDLIDETQRCVEMFNVLKIIDEETYELAKITIDV